MNKESIIVLHGEKITDSVYENQCIENGFTLSYVKYTDVDSIWESGNTAPPSIILIETESIGPECIQVLEDIKATARIPVVAIVPQEVKECCFGTLQKGADDCIKNPINPMELVMRVRRLIKRYNMQAIK
ncbi:MAG: hypothetical protein OCC49_19470 [Fibrobacterales bacterium]